MIIFGIECCTPHGSVALLKDGKILYQHEWTAQNTQGESVMPNVDRLFSSSNLRPKDIDIIAIDGGPGRFTGVRVGISIAKSLSFSLQKPVFVANSLELMAFDSISQMPNTTYVLSVLNAYKNMLFTALYQNTPKGLHAIISPSALKIEEVLSKVPDSTLCVGEGYKFLKALDKNQKLTRNPSTFDYPKASSLVQFAYQSHINTSLFDWKSLEPLYIRASEAEERLSSL